MKDYARILVDKDGLSSLQEVIHIGKEVVEKKLKVYEKKIREFERANGMDNETFVISFNRGDLGDSKEWLEWDHVANVAVQLNKKLKALEKLRYEY